MTQDEFDDANRNSFIVSMATAAGISVSKVEILGVSSARRAGADEDGSTTPNRVEHVLGSWTITERLRQQGRVARGVGQDAMRQTLGLELVSTNAEVALRYSPSGTRRAASVAVETLVQGRMTQLFGLLTGTEALNAALVANGLPASTGVLLKGVNDGTMPPPPPPTVSVITPEPRLTDEPTNLIVAVAVGFGIVFLGLLCVFVLAMQKWIRHQCSADGREERAARRERAAEAKAAEQADKEKLAQAKLELQLIVSCVKLYIRVLLS